MIDLNDLNYQNVFEVGYQTWFTGRLSSWFLRYDPSGQQYGLTQKIHTLPEHFGNLTNLVSLYIDRHEILYLPSSFSNLTSLNYLLLEWNQFTGEIPVEICNQGDTRVGNNQLCPPYPDCISQDDIDSQDTSNCP